MTFELPSKTLGNAESDLRSHQAALAMITRYDGWTSERSTYLDESIWLRGHLGLETIKSALKVGIAPTIVDNGSSTEFVAAARALGAEIRFGTQPGISLNRQAAIRHALAADSPFIISSEPEKIDIARTAPAMLKPLIDGSADIVIPYRTEAAWDTYPPEQRDFETSINAKVNMLLRSCQILGADSPDIDLCFGPSAFTADSARRFFLNWLDLGADSEHIKRVGIDPATYGNVMVFPPIDALIQRARVVSVPVDYVHPEVQTQFETGNPAFVLKREQQYWNMIGSLVFYLRYRGYLPGRSDRLR